MLVAYGVSVALGNVWGGRLADRLGPVPALQRIFLLLAVVLLVLGVTAHYRWAAALTVLAWGAVAFGNVPGCSSMWCAGRGRSRRRLPTWPRASISPPSTSAWRVAPGPAG